MTTSADTASTVRLTDAGIETVLTFQRGIELPAFAAFPLLESTSGRKELSEYFGEFLQLAGSTGAGFVLETPTWRANPDWAQSLGYDESALQRINRDAVAFAQAQRTQSGGDDVLISGCVGPRGDGYVPGTVMSSDEAATYHRVQLRALSESGADLATSFTFPYSAEGIGFAAAAAETGLACVVGFTVETDGRLPSGESLADAVRSVDEATGGYPSWFMINCAHPDHIAAASDGGDWQTRIGALRANASRLSHAELDVAEELDDGNPDEFASGYATLRESFPQLAVFGGCCGTDIRHVRAVAWQALGL